MRIRRGEQPIVCHARAVARRLRLPALGGLRRSGAVRLRPPGAVLRADAARAGRRRCCCRRRKAATRRRPALFAACRALLAELTASPGRDATADRLDDGARRLARGRRRCWPRWAPAHSRRRRPEDALRVWLRLPEWDERAAGSAARFLAGGAGRGARAAGPAAGRRCRAAAAAAALRLAVAAAFAPREQEGEPRVVLAEAGTGVGKTLGYVAPATLWAEKNGGRSGSPPTPATCSARSTASSTAPIPICATRAARWWSARGARTVLPAELRGGGRRSCRCGREDAVALGLVARWALASRDGDMVGGDFPAWLPTCSAAALTVGLADRRGECIYGACPHYRQLLRRALDPPRAPGRHRHRQPCAGHGAGGAGRTTTVAAAALRLRRGPPPVRRRRRRLLAAPQRPRGGRAAPLAARRRGGRAAAARAG